jgi:hypothetical protein
VLLGIWMCTTKSSSPAKNTFNDHTRSGKVWASSSRDLDGSAHVPFRLWQLLIILHLVFNMIPGTVVRKNSFSYFH